MTAGTVAFFVVYALFGLSQVGSSLTGLGGTVAFTKAAQDYKSHMEDLQHRYLEATIKAGSNGLLEFKWLTQKADIGPKRELVQKVIESDKALREAVANGEKNFRQALVDAGVPQKMTDDAVRGFNQARADGKLELMLKVRDTDIQVFSDAGKLLDLLEAQWGHWSRTDGGLAFEDDAALDQFNGLLHDIQKAAAAQGEAEKKLTALGMKLN